jgi:hypothetical protein
MPQRILTTCSFGLYKHLTWISQTQEVHRAENLRESLCRSDYSRIQGAPRCRQSVRPSCSNLKPLSGGQWWPALMAGASPRTRAPCRWDRSIGASCGVVACVDGPLDAREKVRNLTGGSIAIMCPALSTRLYDRWPRWDPRSSPKHGCDFASRCKKRVLWIVGPTDCHLIQLFHPGLNARFRCHRLMPVGRDARYLGPCQSGHLVVQSRPKPRGGSIA